jgi:hypothetical protein
MCQVCSFTPDGNAVGISLNQKHNPSRLSEMDNGRSTCSKHLPLGKVEMQILM